MREKSILHQRYNMTKLRVHGNVLGEDDAFIDVKIGKYRINGNVKITEVNGKRTWEIKADELQNELKKGEAISHDDLSIPNHHIWDLLSTLKGYTDSKELAGIHKDLLEVEDRLFKSIVNQERHQQHGKKDQGKSRGKGRNGGN